MRAAYFAHLEALARQHVGLCDARLPEYAHPLFFRAGTSDIANLLQIFRDGEYDFALHATPRRILDLGAYVGYAAVFLARRFPAAQIFCIEPSPSSFRMLLLNTLPYRAISHLNAAVWRQAGRLALAGLHGGDWGNQLAEPADPKAGGIVCHGVADLLRLRGWPSADYIKCDIEGAEAAVFADPAAAWLAEVEALSADLHDHMQPGCADAIAACFDPAQFETSRRGEFVIYQRRQTTRAADPPAELALIHASAGLSPMRASNVSAEIWGCFLFEDRGCQLHPNPPGGPPAQLGFTCLCDGQSRFLTSLAQPGRPAGEVVFRVLIRRLADDAILLDAEARLPAGGQGEWSERTPLLHGPHEIVLQTAMAEGAADNWRAWARWINPRLC